MEHTDVMVHLCLRPSFIATLQSFRQYLIGVLRLIIAVASGTIGDMLLPAMLRTSLTLLRGQIRLSKWFRTRNVSYRLVCVLTRKEIL